MKTSCNIREICALQIEVRCPTLVDQACFI